MTDPKPPPEHRDDPKTVFKANSPHAAITPPKQTNHTAAKNAANYQELTRIDKAVRSNDLSAGFIEAKKMADQALAGDKIILNKRFVLKSTLGSGGMGTVYRAQDLRKVEASDLNPYVAVKVLNDDFRNHPDAFVSLQREASRSHILSHPNIVTVHDFDRDGDIFYMTMELLEGKGLEIILRKYKDKGLPVKRALQIINDYCNGLIYAHKKNIVHSDLKPGNLFVSKEGTKVLDFGIARITNQAAAQNDFDAGTLGALTPAYASLEMFQGEPPHPSDDVYAAAIIAYELFTGTHPYNRKSADKVFQEKLKPKRIPNLSNRQWKALSSALQIERGNRTQSLEVFLEDLTQVKKFPIFKVLTAILLVLILIFGYLWFIKEDDLSQQVNTSYTKAEQCFNQADYLCALDGAKAVLEMLPNHSQAKELKSKSENLLKTVQLVNTIDECIRLNQNLNCTTQPLQKLKLHAPNTKELLNSEEKVTDYKRKLEHLSNLKASRECFAQLDYDCAKEQAEKSILIFPDDIEALKLLNSINSKITQLQKDNQEAESIYNKEVANARRCIEQKNFNCAIESLQKASKAKPEDETAKALLQQTQFTKTQYASNLNIVKNLLKKGGECYNNKNYSCAIANADSALEVINDYSAAISLKQKATKAIQDLKKQIQIE